MADPSVTERFYPFSSGPGEFVTEEDWAVMAQGYQDDGVYGHPGSNSLTIEPGPEPGTIQINPGDAQLGGFHYRLTAPKVIQTVANSTTEFRWDIVVLQLNTDSKVIEPVLLTNAGVWAVGEGQAPLGLWGQPPSTEVTADYWGWEIDARWFIGARIRPYLPDAIPPATPGGLIYNPSADGNEAIYIGKLDGNGNPYWAPWYPLAEERMDTVEVWSTVDKTTRSTGWVAGNPHQVVGTFTAPPSGAVFVTIYAQLECEQPSTAYFAFEVRNGGENGSLFLAADKNVSVTQQGDQFHGGSLRKRVSGLTPGNQYTVKTVYTTSNGSSTATIFQRMLLIEPEYTTVAPGEAPSGGGLIDPTDVVLTSGGSTIQLPNGNISTQALRVHIPAGDRAEAVDTMGFYVNTGTDATPSWQRVTWFNEYGEPRVIPSSVDRVGLRIKANPGQVGDLAQFTDIDNNVLSGVKADGELYGPNIGNAKVSAGPEPTNPVDGDLWVDLASTPPVLKIRANGGWSALNGEATVPDDPNAAPAFMGVQSTEVNWTSIDVPLPGGETYLACIAWNSADALTSVPAEWTLVREVVETSGRAAVYTVNAADVNTSSFSLPTQQKITAVCVGYQASIVAASDGLPDAGSDGAHEAPALDVQQVPARLVRFYWDKSAGTTDLNANDAGATTRGVQYGTGAGSCAVLATDQEITSAGVVPLATATADVEAANAGGFSIALAAA
ncbi:hypothetical protein [Actinomadura sp. WMMB 499]|uniref:hypothetical protein n=1 Tax=Actinomadura sp. WMMB 499 TaxID=1219491 RepID=UPI0012490CF9|nr:hypothetical protein [Actinomadura sp. WMMB 499]QFG25442.1 hypothetical protein F7P10_34060 [Actinomadura sp. WMMB 499]